jgi:hypothetical protein
MRAIREHGERLCEAGPRRAAEFGVERAKQRYWSVFAEVLSQLKSTGVSSVASGG